MERKDWRPTPQEARDLLNRAQAARANAYAPYSGFSVGAALLDGAGRVHTAGNVENASYGLTVCAERSAVVAAVAQGARRFRSIAVAGPDPEVPCMPCGACRQVLHEFAPDLWVVVDGPGGHPRLFTLRELLPGAFGPRTLDDARGG